MATTAVCLCAVIAHGQTANSPSGEGWPTYGGDPGGQRYSTAHQITRANVNSLHPVWTYHTHALDSGNLSVSKSDFEDTPILFRDTLYIVTPFDRIIALDPGTGAERWTYDPQLAKDVLATNYTSRGVATWQGTSPGNCAARIFVATLDARLIAVDAATGHPCEDFGAHGQVDLKQGVPTRPDAPYHFFGNTSPAAVVGDVVIIGSAVADNQAVSVESGVVRAFDARSGKLLWSWEPLPWAAHQTPRTGAGNAWAVLAADLERGIVYVPTGSPSPDFYGGLRPGDNRDANSLIALDAKTGRKLWAFQLIHHDVWDYDVAAEPLLFDYKGTPAVAVAAKPGTVFLLNRLTGEPLIPITERPAPRSNVPGEVLSPTQPTTSLQMNPLSIDPKAVSPECAARLAPLRYEGPFTPPGLDRGTLQFPGSLGGVNWGSMSFDPQTATLYANTNRSAYEIRLYPQRRWYDSLLEDWWLWLLVAVFVAVLWRKKPGFLLALAFLAASVWIFFHDPNEFLYSKRHNMVNSPDSFGEFSANKGAPYRIFRRVLQDAAAHPCAPQPWGTTTALNLSTGRLAWEKPLGTLIPGQQTGTVNLGAPIVTAGGLLFTAASEEPLLRAIDKLTGEQVWTGALPVPAQSTPMTYLYGGKQFVVVAAGGHGGLGTPLGDSVIAFALK